MLIISRSKLYYTASGIITPVGGRPVHRSSLTIILVINKLNAQNIISLLYASTCFEYYVLINRRSKLYYTASGIITPVGGRPVHRLRADLSPISTCARDGLQMSTQCSKHVEAYNKLIIKQDFGH